MMATLIFFADHLIEFMGAVLLGALVVRWVSYKAALRDRAYFNTFARSVEKVLESQVQQLEVRNIDLWLSDLLSEVTELLPSRSLRGKRSLRAREEQRGGTEQNESLVEYAEGRRSILHAVRHQTDAFKSPFPPNFTEITYRVLGEDRQWKQILGVPVEMLVRMMDILPGIFVVFGILGTFIGIAAALPQIASLDLGRIQDSGPVLQAFIESVSLSMKCSIAGIFCSIVMTVLNALYPIYSPRAEVRRNLERCFELMWQRVHGAKMTYADSRVIELLDRISTQLAQRGSPPIKGGDGASNGAEISVNPRRKAG